MADSQFYLVGMIGAQTVPALIQSVSDRVGKGARSVLLAISSPGGNIYWGVTAYNFLRGLGIEVITHNVGQVDSVAAVIYSAGDRRLSVPDARFVIHGVSLTFEGTNVMVSEKDLRSRITMLERPGFRSCWAQKALGSADLSTDEAQKWVRGAHQHRYYGDAHIVLTR